MAAFPVFAEGDAGTGEPGAGSDVLREAEVGEEDAGAHTAAYRRLIASRRMAQSARPLAMRAW